jgi:hypothetical protein
MIADLQEPVCPRSELADSHSLSSSPFLLPSSALPFFFFIHPILFLCSNHLLQSLHYSRQYLSNEKQLLLTSAKVEALEAELAELRDSRSSSVGVVLRDMFKTKGGDGVVAAVEDKVEQAVGKVVTKSEEVGEETSGVWTEGLVSFGWR